MRNRPPNNLPGPMKSPCFARSGAAPEPPLATAAGFKRCFLDCQKQCTAGARCTRYGRHRVVKAPRVSCAHAARQFRQLNESSVAATTQAGRAIQ